MRLKKQKALVFFNEGIGDAFLLIPLLNLLKQNNVEVHGVFVKPNAIQSIFQKQLMLENVAQINTKLGALLFSIRCFKRFDLAYVNHLVYSKKSLFIAGKVSKKIVAIQKSPAIKLKNKIYLIKPIDGINDMIQNLRMLDEALLSMPNEELIKLVYFKPVTNELERIVRVQDYIAVQVSSGNGNAPYKSWSKNKWIELFIYLKDTYPNQHLILLGDSFEAEIGSEISTRKLSNCTSLIGKTSLEEAITLIQNAKFFIGLDGGLMHIASFLKKPCLVIWGGSDPNKYAYNKLFPENWKLIIEEMNCRPCDSWINPNKNKTSDPIKCPDFACLAEISALRVFKEVELFLKNV